MSGKKAIEYLKDFGRRVVHEVKKGKNPEIELPLRSLNNIIYDKKTRTLKLGKKTSSSMSAYTFTGGATCFASQRENRRPWKRRNGLNS